ncbi:MAG TPA: hypothetical protein VFJ58_15340 [Armatimonadota bacterium]|nr:hypothetical protein [Armatimonadota bacterium]
MSNFHVEFDWQKPHGVQGPELRATWANLKLTVDGEIVTTLADRVSCIVRDSITLPLYPLAEWIATHWWALQYELMVPGRAAQDTYDERHCLFNAREGYAIPALRVVPLGESVYLECNPLEMPANNLRFVKGGSTRLPLSEFRDEVTRFLNAVIARLHERGVQNTLLADEWDAIQQVDEDERQFCIASAELGLDPYDLDSEQRDAILKTAADLPPSLLDDFLNIADPASLSNQSHRLRRGLDDLASLQCRLTGLIALRRTLTDGVNGRPWDQGYRAAQTLRQIVGANGHIFESIDDIGKVLQIDSSELPRAIIESSELDFVDGLLAVGKNGSPGFIVTKRNEHSKRYHFCRALFEWLNSRTDDPVIVSPARSERQQRNRAFAAEFLAPAKLVQQELSSRSVGDDEISDIADRFHVSDHVIRHQIENHHLARVISG